MLDSLYLTNFVAFAHVRVDFEQLTLLTGGNSGGKSSVLHALGVIRQSHLGESSATVLDLNGEVVNLGTGRDVLHAEPVDLPGLVSGGVAISLEWEGEIYEWIAAYESEADTLQLVKPVARPKFALTSSSFQYLQADRIVPAAVFPKSHSAVGVRNSLGTTGEHTVNYLRVHGEQEIICSAASHPAGLTLQLSDQAEAWVNEISPGTRFRVDDVPGTDFVRLSFSRAGSAVQTPTQRATNVGFGLTYALPIIVACLTAPPGGLLIIENPEAHLHPRAQSVIGKLCALASAGGCQVVIETHSDHVLNAVRLAVKRAQIDMNRVLVNYFHREPQSLEPRVEAVRVGADGSLTGWPKGFFDQWDNDLDSLLDG